MVDVRVKLNARRQMDPQQQGGNVPPVPVQGLVSGTQLRIQGNVS